MLSTLLLTALSAFIPAGIDGVKVLATGLANRISGGALAKPQTFAETLQLIQGETEKLKALALIDSGSGQPSQWVTDLRQSCRYLVAYAIIAMCIATVIISIWVPVADPIVDWCGAMANSVMFFLFGDRVYAGLKGQR